MTLRCTLSLVLVLGFFLLPVGVCALQETEDADYLALDRVVARGKTALEIELESFLKEVFQRDYFRTYEIMGRDIEVRMPFGMNYERDLVGWRHVVFWGGKGRAERVWNYIDEQIESEDFREYVEAISAPKPKVVHFDMPNARYEVLYDERLINRMQKTDYPSSLLAYIYFLKDHDQITNVDVYNYLYAVSRVGMDCTGFVYNINRAIAGRHGIELNEKYAESIADQPKHVPLYIGLHFLDPESPYVAEVDDSIVNLRPGDILMFRGRGDRLIHSAVIQSIDYQGGAITYYQSTDWAPLEQRGVHQSVIEFDPSRPEVSLCHDDVVWHKEVLPAFPGEPAAAYLDTDADRYRPSAVHSGGHVVRLITVRDLLKEHDPLYYDNQLAAGH